MITIDPAAFVHETVVLGQNVTVEAGAYIGPYCLIGMPAEWKGREHEDKGVVIGRRARLTGHVTVDSGVERETFVGDGCYLMKGAHVGHDAQLADNVTISCGAKIGGHTTISPGVNVGLNAVVHQKQHIAEGCMIGMGAVVTAKLETLPYKTYAGNPAKLIGENSKHPKYRKQELIYTAHTTGVFEEGIQICIHCGKVICDYTGSWVSDDGSAPVGWEAGVVISQSGNMTMVGLPEENYGPDDPYTRVIKYCTDKQ